MGSRQLERLRSNLSERDWAVLRDVAACRLMSGAQLQALHWPLAMHATTDAAARSARRCLRRLTDHHVVRRLERRVGGMRAGSAGYLYVVGQVGLRLLGRQHPSGGSEPGYAFIEHTLAIADVFVTVKLLERADAIELDELATETTAWRPFVGSGGARQVLAPDAFVRYFIGDDELAWFIEVDRGTEHRSTLQQKAERYLAYYRSGREQAERGYFPRVLWLVPNADRADVCRSVFRPTESTVPGLFLVVEHHELRTTLVPEADT